MRQFRSIAAAAVISLMVSPAPSIAGEARPWLVSLFANYNKWDTGDVDNDGVQSLVYTQIAYDTQRWGAAVTGTYAGTSYKTTQSEDRFDVKTFTDTAVSTYYSVKHGGLKLRGGVDVSLPTGKSSFSSDELARVIADDIDEDLMLMNSYGAGLNISPHLAATYDMKRVTLGAGLKYVFAGAYDPVTDMDGDEFDPGDRLSLILSVNASAGASGYLMLTGSYTVFDKDRLGGRDVFRNGDMLSLEGRYIRRWTQSLRNTIGVIFTSQDKNEAIGDGDVMKSETGNSNANKIEVFADAAYDLGGRLTLTGIAGYKTVAANGYSEGDDLHDAGRAVIYIDPGMIAFFRDDVYATLKLRYARIEDKKDAFSPENARYGVFNLDAGVVFSF